MKKLSSLRRVSGGGWKRVMPVCGVLLVSLVSACGDDEGPHTNGGNGDDVNHALECRLASMTLDGENRFSDAIYDEYGRVTAYTGGYNYKYFYRYESDKIVRSSRQDAEDGTTWIVKNGRIVACEDITYEYDAQGRLVKELHYGLNGGGWQDAVIEWENGNVKAVNIEIYNKDGSYSGTPRYRYEYTYGVDECKSVMMYAKDRADKIESPYVLLQRVDPILVAEGYFGNSSLKNLVTASKRYESGASASSYVTNISWKTDADGLPEEAVQTQPGYRSVWAMKWE